MKDDNEWEACLGFPVTPHQIGLAYKPPTEPGAKHKVGAGFLNGLGGGIDAKDKGSEFAAMVRELPQESELRVRQKDLMKVAVMTFNNQRDDLSEFVCRVHIFLFDHWKGAPRATKEMEALQFYPRNNLPLARMMPADRIWLPAVLAGKFICGEAWYGPRQAYLREQGCTYREVQPLDLLGLRPRS